MNEKREAPATKFVSLSVQVRADTAGWAYHRVAHLVNELTVYQPEAIGPVNLSMYDYDETDDEDQDEDYPDEEARYRSSSFPSLHSAGRSVRFEDANPHWSHTHQGGPVEEEPDAAAEDADVTGPGISAEVNPVTFTSTSARPPEPVILDTGGAGSSVSISVDVDLQRDWSVERWLWWAARNAIDEMDRATEGGRAVDQTSFTLTKHDGVWHPTWRHRFVSQEK